MLILATNFSADGSNQALNKIVKLTQIQNYTPGLLCWV
jgi:hypothetical protein